MIRVTCPSCQSSLNAKDELVGETRKCPQCGAPILIAEPDAPSEPLDETVPEEHVRGTSEMGLPPLEVPGRLDRQNHYLICDRSKLVATWKDDGQGWMLKTNTGLVSAVRNPDQLPNQGDFKLVELKMEMTDAGLRLAGITSYQLAQRWALTCLDKGHDKIVSRITGLGCLNRDQKHVVRQVIKDHFMREVWAEADNVLEYLANTDYHSPGTVADES
jgi:hypothetical protein